MVVFPQDCLTVAPRSGDVRASELTANSIEKVPEIKAASDMYCYVAIRLGLSTEMQKVRSLDPFFEEGTSSSSTS